MPTYYVATTGSDSNDGSSANPWKSLNKAVTAAPAGTAGNPTMILVRSGVYNCESTGILNHKLVVNKSWLTIKAETPGNRPIFRHTMQMGNPLPDENHGNLILVPDGTNGITLDGLQIERFSGTAIRFGNNGQGDPQPSDITVRNCVTYWTRGQGINIYGSNSTKPEKFSRRVLVENNRVVCASMISLMGTDNQFGGDNASGAIRVGNTWSAVIRGNRIEYSFGEGGDWGKRLWGTPEEPVLLYGNYVINCHHVHFYLLHVRHVLCFNNIVYSTQGNGAVELQAPYDPGNTYKINDERPDLYGSSENVWFYNNLGIGGDAVFQISAGDKDINGKTYRQDVKFVYAGFNTLLGGYFTTKSMVDTGPYLENSLFENNIVDDVNARKGSGYRITRDPFNTVRQNAWTAEPSSPWRHGQSVVHADLGMVAPHVDLRTTGWGMNYGTLADFDANVSDNFNLANYHLTASARARNVAGPRQNAGSLIVPLAPFQVDYRGATRAQPDMGFHEASGQITVNVVADFSAMPGGTALDTGTAVSFTNESVVTGTTVTSYTWTVKRGTTTMQTAGTTHFSYTFPTAGSYTVSLLVTTPEGNDTHTVNYTISDPTTVPTVTAAIGRAPGGFTHEAGTTVTFTDNSTFTACTFVSRLWEVKSGATVLASSTASPYAYQFNTPGTFTVKLTENASGGLSDTETLTYTITAPPAEVVANFTASDADLIVEEGESITFTNTSTAAGTTIAGYLWTVEKSGGGTETFTTTNLTYTFPTAGIWTVTLRATGANGSVDTHHVIVIVQSGGGPVGGSTFMVAAKPFALATSTGTQTVTAPALGTMVPKGVHLVVVGATAAGTAATGALWSEGAAMTGAQWAHARFSANGQGVSAAKRRESMSDIFLSLDAAGAITGRASFVGFVPGGMEIDLSDAPPGAYLAVATFYAGEDCQFACGSTAPGTRDAATPVAVGFRPDAVYLMSTWTQDEATVTADADMTRGWAVRAGEEGVQQAHVKNEDRDTADTTLVLTRLYDTLAASSADGATGFMSLTVLSLDTSGFTMRPNSSTMSRLLSWFAFATGGPAVQLVTANTLAAPTPAPLSLPFAAQTVLALTSTMRTLNDQLSGIDGTGQGWYVRSLNDSVEYSLAMASASGAATSSTRSLASTGFRAVWADGSDAWNGAGALDAAGLAVAMSAAPVEAYYTIILAIEEGEVIDDPTGGPIANFTATFDPVPEMRRVAVWFDSSLSNGDGEDITAWAWEFGDGATSEEANPLHIYEGVGEYDVTLTITTAAGTDSETKAGFVVIEEPAIEPDELIGMSPPATSGGDTENRFDDEYNHSHFIAGAWLNLKPLVTQEEVDAFVARVADPVYALWAWDEVGNRMLVKRTDGAVRVIATAAL
jgi:PKD repeat protein